MRTWSQGGAVYVVRNIEVIFIGGDQRDKVFLQMTSGEKHTWCLPDQHVAKEVFDGVLRQISLEDT